MKMKLLMFFAVLATVFVFGNSAISAEKTKSRENRHQKPQEKVASQKFQVDAETDALFLRGSYTMDGNTLPYRIAETCPEKSNESVLVIYLHGGSVKGNDNEAQLTEPVGKILFDYFQSRGIKAKIILPQCPPQNDWSKKDDFTVKAIKSLADSLVKNGSVDKSRIYLFGGSFGSHGVWNLLDSYPEFFASAMTCAARPQTSQLKNAAKTPVFCVIGGKDKLASLDAVKTAVEKLKSLGAEIRFEIEAEFDHGQVCRESYTDARLDWVFSHARSRP